MLAALSGAAVAAESGWTPSVTPAVVEMGALYSGTVVRVEGAAPPASQAVVVVRGEEKHEIFNRKRQFGPIWISSGRIQVSGVPSFWMVFSPTALEKILSPEAIRRHALNRGAILERVHLEPAEDASPRLRQDFLNWKTQQNLFAERIGAVQAAGAAGGDWSLEFVWPRTAPPGNYAVHVYYVRGGEVTEEADVALRAVKVGLPSRIAWMASERARLYGILCVLLAVAAGFGMDRLVAMLGGKRRGGH